MDDFDELLDEVERELSKGPKKPKKNTVKKRSSLENEIDDILNDTPDLTPIPINTKNSAANTKNCPGTTKCCTLYIGGSSAPSDLSTYGCKKACDRLRCTSCDFKVEQFNDFEWDKTVDYLFLRNNMPDFHKLSSRLRRKPGFRAYACQCSWISVEVLTSLLTSELKWVCSKH